MRRAWTLFFGMKTSIRAWCLQRQPVAEATIVVLFLTRRMGKSKGTNPQVAKVVTCETALLQCHCYYCYLLMMRECLPRLTTHCLTCTSPRCINSPHCLGLDVAVMPTLSRQASSHKTFVDAQQKAFDSYGNQKRPRGVAMSPLPNGATSEGGIIPFFMMWS